MDWLNFYSESKLDTDERNNLDDSMFGIPSKRKYPMPDKEHVRKAVQFFQYADKSDRRKLAKRIVSRAKELGMDWENWDSITHYISESYSNNSSELIKVESPKFDKMYFGSPNYLGSKLVLSKHLFCTPYKGIASIFTASKTV